jgi:hypothetical protein
MAVVKAMAQVMIKSAKGPNLLMAACTRKIAVFAQEAIIKKFPAQLYPFRCKRVNGKVVFRLRPACRNSEFDSFWPNRRRNVLIFFAGKTATNADGN